MNKLFAASLLSLYVSTFVDTTPHWAYEGHARPNDRGNLTQ